MLLLAYPPTDALVRDYLCGSMDGAGARQRFIKFFTALFEEGLLLLSTFAEEPSYQGVARHFHAYFADTANRRLFHSRVIKKGI